MFSILVVLLIIAGVSTCSDKKAEKVTTEVKEVNFRAYIVDSVNSANNVQKIAEIQLVKDSVGKQALQYKKKAYFYMTEASKQKEKSDSLESLITDTTCLKVIESKQAEINYLDSALTETDKEAERYSRQYYLCEEQSELKDAVLESKSIVITKLNDNIEALQKSNKRNWLERNKMWVGFVGGVIGTGLILK